MSLRCNCTLTVDALDSLACCRPVDFPGNVKFAVGGKTCENAVDEDERVKLRKIEKNHFSQDKPDKKDVSVEDLLFISKRKVKYSEFKNSFSLDVRCSVRNVAKKQNRLVPQIRCTFALRATKCPLFESKKTRI